MVHATDLPRAEDPEVESEERMDGLSASIDCRLAGRREDDELLPDSLLDVLEERSLTGASPSRKEETVVGPFNHPVGGSLLVVGAVEFCFHVFLRFCLSDICNGMS